MQGCKPAAESKPSRNLKKAAYPSKACYLQKAVSFCQVSLSPPGHGQVFPGQAGTAAAGELPGLHGVPRAGRRAAALGRGVKEKEEAPDTASNPAFPAVSRQRGTCGSEGADLTLSPRRPFPDMGMVFTSPPQQTAGGQRPGAGLGAAAQCCWPMSWFGGKRARISSSEGG